MATLFSFASWNVENLTDDSARVQRIVQFMANQNPDVFALLEVKGKYLYRELMAQMPDHSFFITEGPWDDTQDILVGINRKFPSFMTQREEFKSKLPSLRPGALVSMKVAGTTYTLLFVHMKAMDDPRSWGLRDDMFQRVCDLKKALDGLPDSPATGANIICLGDCNTVGMNVTYSDKDFSQSDELKRFQDKLAKRDLELLSKTHDFTLWGGSQSTYPQANVDNVFATKTIKFDESAGAKIQVLGWPTLPAAEQDQWISEHSDHAMIYGQVTTD